MEVTIIEIINSDMMSVSNFVKNSPSINESPVNKVAIEITPAVILCAKSLFIIIFRGFLFVIDNLFFK